MPSMAQDYSMGASGPRMASFQPAYSGSHVDESLFGSKDKTAARRGGSDKEIQIVGKDTVQVRKKFSRVAGAGAAQDAIVIGASELDRLRNHAKLLTKEEELEQKKRADEAYAERMKKSIARKEKIRQLEEERKKNALLADNEKDGRAQKNSVLERAKNMLDEDMDDVKHMNQMMLYSKVVTIRDAQIQEKRNVQAEKEEEERQLDAMMEIERLKALRMYEVREKERLESQRSGAKVIVEQIKD